MRSLFLSMFTVAILVGVSPNTQAADDSEEVKEALQELQEFIGGWKGSGESLRPGGAKGFWPVKIDWSWRFKKGEIYFTAAFRKGKFWKSGELRYLLDDEKFQFILIDEKDQKRVFEGELKNRYLTLTHVDKKTKETQQITLNTAGDGVRLILQYAHKPKNRTRFVKDYRLAMTKEGESLGRVEKKKECIVTGGLGTSTVSYKGKTYWVCCSGCKDAFNENPEKFVKEWLKKKRR